MKNLINGWEVVIGLEVHAQIAANTKLFSKSSTNFGASPNSQVSFFDAAMPGTLPIVNQFCVDQAIMSGLGIHGTINKISRFDRKNYFYPDLPAGYQISQLYQPIASNGYINITLKDGACKTVNIERIHIEQDAGKSVHDLDSNYSYIDLNRAGIALMEIVSKPDLCSSAEAMLYVKKLKMILQYIKTCDCNMEKGNFRVDANVSIRRPEQSLGTRTEIKNLNSIRFIGQAIDYEVIRQIDIIENGGKIVQETMLFDSILGKTIPMRSKENADDYRYFPDPDLKPVILSTERIKRIMQQLPELPDEKKERFIKIYDLSEYDVDILISSIETADLFEKAALASKFKNKETSKQIANWFIGDLFSFLNKESKTIENIPFPIEYISELIDLVFEQFISHSIAKTVFAQMIETNEKPIDIIQKHCLMQIQDNDLINKIIDEILQKYQSQVKEYQNGKEQMFGFFVGETMKMLKGKANPKIINEILRRKLSL